MVSRIRDASEAGGLFQPGRARKFMSFSFLNTTQEKLFRVPRGRKLVRMVHPLNAASNTYFFVSVSKLEKKRLA